MKRWLPTTLLLAGGLAAGWLWWVQGAGAPAVTPAAGSAPVARAAASPVMAAPAAPAFAGSLPGNPTAPAAGRPPPGLSAEQWSALAQELSARPDAAAELGRLRDYLVWSDTVARWREAAGDAALAAQVRDGLPDRLARREVSAPEARVLLAALLPALEPDADRRALALQAFERTLPAPAGPDAREQAFQRDQAAAVAAWRRAPEAARDPAALQAELERLRRLHFAPATAAPAAASPPPQERSS